MCGSTGTTYIFIYTSFLVTQVRARANRWLAGKIYYKLKLTNCKQIVSCLEII